MGMGLKFIARREIQYMRGRGFEIGPFYYD